jgi:dihydroxyacetone kinase-like protein
VNDPVHEWLSRCLEQIEAAQAELNSLDAVAGDGDHGVTMVLALRAAVEKTSALRGADTALVLREAAAAFASVGGSIGPLWGTAFLRAGKVLDSGISPDAIVDAARAAVQGMRDRGRAEVGDKTLLDAMTPAVDALCKAVENGDDLATAVRAGAEGAAQGRDATATLAPARGRASRAPARSIGRIDPGAASCALMWQAAARMCEQTS